MSFTWSNLLSSKLGLCRNGKFSHMSARYDFSCLYSMLSIYCLKSEWGWGVGSGDTTVDEALTCHQRGPGSSKGVEAISTRVEFAAGFLPFSERFLSGFSSFPLSSKNKNQHSKFQSVGESVSSKRATGLWILRTVTCLPFEVTLV